MGQDVRAIGKASNTKSLGSLRYMSGKRNKSIKSKVKKYNNLVTKETQ